LLRSADDLHAGDPQKRGAPPGQIFQTNYLGSPPAPGAQGRKLSVGVQRNKFRKL
jgi:hypothetical protein